MANYFWQGAALSQLCSSSNLEDKKNLLLIVLIKQEEIEIEEMIIG